MKYFDGELYLKTFWPKKHKSNDMWQDNYFLLNSYVKASKKISNNYTLKFDCFDISTGPVLAPIISICPIINSIQLSDYCESGRRHFLKTPSFYWIGYTKEILKLEKKNSTRKAIIERLDSVKSLLINKFIDIDLKSKDIINEKKIDLRKFDLFTMHFVADSITDSKEEYANMISKVSKIMKKGSFILMSVLIESSKWHVGDTAYPSPNLKYDEVESILSKNNLLIVFSSLQNEAVGELGHDGRFAVFACKKYEI